MTDQASPRSETPTAFIRAILLAYERRGIDPGMALAEAGIAAEAARDPAGRVSADQLERLSDLAMRALDDEALGWFSRRLPWGSYGLLLRASLTAPTLDIALRRWCRHHALLTEDVRITPEISDIDATARITEAVDLGPFREFCLVSLLRNLHGVACWLVDSRIPLVGARFPFPAPPHAGAYARMFGGAIVFGAAEASLSLDAGYLRLPVLRDDASLRALLRRPLPLMARRYRQDRLLSRRIVRVLAAGGDAPEAPRLAEALNVSLRSLQRHLREEGTSLTALRAEARRLRAETLLRRADLPIKRVARLVGYGDESSFGRAFRAWTGRTPAEFRRLETALPGPRGAISSGSG